MLFRSHEVSIRGILFSNSAPSDFGALLKGCLESVFGNHYRRAAADSVLPPAGGAEEVPDGAQEQRGESGEVPGGAEEAAQEEPGQQEPGQVRGEGDAGKFPMETHYEAPSTQALISTHT